MGWHVSRAARFAQGSVRRAGPRLGLLPRRAAVRRPALLDPLDRLHRAQLRPDVACHAPLGRAAARRHRGARHRAADAARLRPRLRQLRVSRRLVELRARRADADGLCRAARAGAAGEPPLARAGHRLPGGAGRRHACGAARSVPSTPRPIRSCAGRIRPTSPARCSATCGAGARHPGLAGCLARGGRARAQAAGRDRRTDRPAQPPGVHAACRRGARLGAALRRARCRCC